MGLLPQKQHYDVTFICRNNRQYFAQPILDELEKTYAIQYLYPEHKRELAARKIAGEIIWVEWATKFAWAVSKRKRKHKKVVVRLHRYELETAFMEKIRWDNVDLVLFVNKLFEREFKKKINDKVPTVTIPNAVAVQDFPYFAPKDKRPGEETQLISYSLTFHPVKGYLELIRFFKQLVAMEPTFRLTIMARKPQTKEEDAYLASLRAEAQRLAIAGKIDFLLREVPVNLVEDRKRVSHILADYDIFIGFSRLESFHYAFAESMLSGLQCFYNGWQNPYLQDYWGTWASRSEEEMLRAITQWLPLSLAQKKEITMQNRAYVINNFGAQVVSTMYEKEFFGKR